MLRDLRAVVGQSTNIFLCVPFGGFGSDREHAKAPKGALKDGYLRYMESKQDPNCFYVALPADVARNLTGMPRGKCANCTPFPQPPSGSVPGVQPQRTPTHHCCRFITSAVSFDGVHPTASRHAEIGCVLPSSMFALHPACLVLSHWQR